MFQALEARRLLSAAVEDGRLHIVGTERDDRIVVETGTAQGDYPPSAGPLVFIVTINGVETRIDGSAVKSLFIEGLGGDDKIVYGRGYENTAFVHIIGPLDPDALISGGNGDDTILGGGEEDVLVGGRGDDLLHGRSGNDRLEGGEGHDTLRGDAGSDDLRGGNGHDGADYSGSRARLRVSLDDIRDDGAIESPADWDAPLNPRFREGDNAHSDIEDIWGGMKNDTLTGNNGPNTLVGGGGNDVLRGLGGKDVLSGGRGNDTLTGGGGNGRGGDYYAGGAGNDTASDFLLGWNVASRDTETGTFIGRFRTDIGFIGGDTTGYVLQSLDGSVLFDVVVPENLKEQANELGGTTLTIKGHFTIINFTERGQLRGIVVDEFIVPFTL